jgi:hypothetical protein
MSLQIGIISIDKYSPWYMALHVFNGVQDKLFSDHINISTYNIVALHCITHDGIVLEHIL